MIEIYHCYSFLLLSRWLFQDMFGIIFELLSDLQKSKRVRKRQLYKEFNPFILILHHNKDHIISYDLYMASDGIYLN